MNGRGIILLMHPQSNTMMTRACPAMVFAEAVAAIPALGACAGRRLYLVRWISSLEEGPLRWRRDNLLHLNDGELPLQFIAICVVGDGFFEHALQTITRKDAELSIMISL